MTLHIDCLHYKLNKYGEELCGDSVEVLRTSESHVLVIADGLGSGVKANILSTLTAKIASQMLLDGATIGEVVATLAETLPVCQVRRLAYSTFTILQIYPRTGEAYLVEFDNPASFYFHNRRLTAIDFTERVFNGRTLREARFVCQPGDLFFLVTDGVIHAGIGAVLNLGWGWPQVADYLQRMVQDTDYVAPVANMLITVCSNLYLGRPGDDATVLGVQVRTPEQLTVLTGPPSHSSEDSKVVQQLLNAQGRKVVCGGSTAKMVARESGRELVVGLGAESPDEPPYGWIAGLDLVTEGVITLNKTYSIIESVVNPDASYEDFRVLHRSTASAKLANLLLNEATHIRFLLGQAVNVAHNSDQGLLPRLEVVARLGSLLKSIGKNVEIVRY